MKRYLIIVLMVVALVFTGCGKTEEKSDADKLADYLLRQMEAREDASAYITAVEQKIVMNILDDDNYDIPAVISDVNFADTRGEVPTYVNFIINGNTGFVEDGLIEFEEFSFTVKNSKVID